MNRLIAFLLATLVVCPAAQAAVAITTNPVCKKLVTAIEQGYKVESCKSAWQNITKSPIIKAEDHAQVITQALQLAQAQKAVFEEELTNLGDETKGHSKVKWGVGQLALGSYLAVGALWTWGNSNYLKKNTLYQRIGFILLPTALGITKDPITKQMPFTAGNVVVFLHATIINHLVGPYLIYKGYHNLRQGLNHKQLLQEKIANLDAIITYLQELQTTNQ